MRKGTAAHDREDWLLLHRAAGVGAIAFSRLLQIFGSPRSALGASAKSLAQYGFSKEVQCGILHADRKSIASDLQWLQAPDHHLVTLADELYPARLREIADAPPVLFVRGEPRWLAAPQLAIVGSRKPTRAGAECAYEFAHALAERGFVITSGLAHGIDAHAHRGCLAAGKATVAITGTGPDNIYPKAHCALAAQIAACGAVATEFPARTDVRPENFPRRNRIISGLSLGVLVVEAASASGSLITARHAIEQGREVFAVPGSLHNPMARGCHALIKQGAKLVECIEDVLEEIPGHVVDGTERRAALAVNYLPPTVQRDQQYTALLDALGHDPAPVDVLVSRTGLTANQVSSMLLTLELEGAVASLAGGLYMRLRPESG